MTPTGHLQVLESGSGKRYYALWRDGTGKRHKRLLGKAWVKPYGVTA